MMGEVLLAFYFICVHLGMELCLAILAHPCIQTVLRCDGVLLLRAGRRCGGVALPHPNEEDGPAVGEVCARPAARLLLRNFIRQAGAKIPPQKLRNVIYIHTCIIRVRAVCFDRLVGVTGC